MDARSSRGVQSPTPTAAGKKRANTPRRALITLPERPERPITTVQGMRASVRAQGEHYYADEQAEKDGKDTGCVLR